ncbi:extracellular solute-binding protein [Hansschlegelia plantiphila]|uniref:Putrescine-binding periplasmic protein n=1 Tax=Hansschlegelia plantiphila TaxID=374655 RepID=A0A9W6MWK6_9HYPH|nr:extracellular solute-binding protein [Hansschlegelia plantiphila]GLK68922.1 ABC transporter [Hansschlegelia plantiphila]
MPARSSLAVAAAALLSACAAIPSAWADAGQIHVYTWADYTSPELLAKFEKETGIKTTVDTFDSNDTLLAKLQAGKSGYDIILPSQNYVSIMIEQGLLEKVDVSSMPNYKNVDEKWRKPEWDPSQSYTVPWQWGTTSIVYMADKFPQGFKSYKDLFEPADGIKGKIQLFRSQDGMLEIAEMYLDAPFCNEDGATLKKIQKLYLDLKPHVKIFDDTGMGDHLGAGETTVALWYSGNAYQARVSNLPNMKYAFPKEGVMGWFDSVAIPKGAPNLENAKKFMNFVMDPENIAIESNYAGDSNAYSASKPFLDPKVAAAEELKVPEGVPLKFARQCPPKAAKLASQVWTSVLK